MDVDWLIAERPGRVKTLKQHPRKNKTAINIEYMKASIRARVEHPFRIIKRQFGFVKARYRGLLKNDNQLAMLFTLANLFGVASENGIYGHSRFCNTDFDDKLACLNLSGV